MLRILSGLDRPDAPGRVRYGDEDVTALPIERRGVGMVFQSYALFPNMTVGGNVAYGPRLRGLNRSERERVARRYLALCRIEALADRRIDQLSGGQRQRVALARALAAEPRAIFLDEPLTALDAGLRETLRDEIGATLGELGVTAVYVTHDQAEAMALADRVVVMSAGRIEQAGSPRDVYQRPANRFVATFVGETNAWPDDDRALFRPEAVRLVAPGMGGSRAATVLSCTYLGASQRVRLDASGRPITAYADGTRAVAVGDEVGVIVAEADLIRLPEAP